MVLGGVAGIPWRLEAAEKLLTGHKIDEALAIKAGQTATAEAIPLEFNRYKVHMVQNLVKRAICELTLPFNR